MVWDGVVLRTRSGYGSDRGGFAAVAAARGEKFAGNVLLPDVVATLVGLVGASGEWTRATETLTVDRDGLSQAGLLLMVLVVFYVLIIDAAATWRACDAAFGALGGPTAAAVAAAACAAFRHHGHE
jgi:hypothetical protein